MPTDEQANRLFEAIKDFVERKVSTMATDVDRLKTREETHFQTIEALMRRIEALERKQGQKSGAVYLTKADR